MTLTPLASRNPANVREALVRRGMDESRATAASQGLHPVALIFDSLNAHERDSLVASAHRYGIECLSGEDWALIAGSTAQLAGLARPGFSTIPDAVAHDLGSFLQHATDVPHRWVMARGSLSLDRPLVVGILNVTPDSFSDGGRFFDTDAAVRQAEAMIEAGADMLDVGGESTRPGRPDPVPMEEEWRRLAPVLTALAKRFPQVPVSVDTVKAATAERALAAGAWAINDVSGLRFDARISEVCATHRAGLILMHSRGSFAEMATYDHARYDDVSAETIRELTGGVARAAAAGVRNESIVLDPGLGFAKNPGHNFEVLRKLPALVSLGFPVMIGPSRKRFLSDGEDTAFEQRDDATAAICVAAYMLGANLFRVHAVSKIRRALDVAISVRTT